jgi:hypothetical protein
MLLIARQGFLCVADSHDCSFCTNDSSAQILVCYYGPEVFSLCDAAALCVADLTDLCVTTVQKCSVDVMLLLLCVLQS